MLGMCVSVSGRGDILFRALHMVHLVQSIRRLTDTLTMKSTCTTGRNMIYRIRYMLLFGLALTGTQENAEFITNLYKKERAYCEANQVKTELYKKD